MFTGIIEDIGRIAAVKKQGRLTIESGLFASGKVGASVAVNGACLTISGIKEGAAVFDILNETAEKTNLQALKARDRVNLE
ncbi:MAG: riboflavin synthase, partial [Candidatus Omnitrophota bacterium]